MLKRSTNQSRVHVISDYITPASVTRLFSAHAVPTDLAMLKIDIDGYDCVRLAPPIAIATCRPAPPIASLLTRARPPHFHMQAVLSSLLTGGWRPGVVFMEVNLEFPPPFAFAVSYSADHAVAKGKGGFFGCSLSAASTVMRPFGYSLLQYAHDASVTTMTTTSMSTALERLFSPCPTATVTLPSSQV